MFARSQGLVCRPNARLYTCMYRPTITNIAGQRLRCKRALIYRLGDTKRLVSSESKTSPDGSSCIRQIKAEEVHEVWQLDAQSYPDYPTQPIEILTRAQRAAPDLFWGHFANGRMTGFACATLSSGSKWTHDSLFNHEPEGAVACLQSLCVYPEFRKMGIAKALVKHLVKHIEDNHNGVTNMCFVCEAHLIPAYRRMGFTYVGPSDPSCLSGEESSQWYDMEYRVPASPKDSE